MMRRLAATVAVLCATVLSACGSAAPTNQSTATADGPHKVVVLDYNALDTLDALGLGDRVVAVPAKTLPTHLVGYKSKKDVGTLMEPDMEAIAGLAPDLIVYGPRTAEKSSELGKIAKAMDVSIDAKSFMTSHKQRTLELADLFGKKADAQSKLDETDKLIAEVKKSATSKADAKALVVMVSGGKLSAFGAKSRFGIIHQDLGVPTAVDDLSTDRHGQAISFEFIAKVNPDIIYVIDRDAAIGQQGESAKKVLDNDLVKSTKAAKGNKIAYLDGSRWYLLGGGLANLSEMVKQIQAPLA